MKVLLVAYYYKPYLGVGALRPTYWAEHMNEIDDSIVLDVLTAQKDVDDRSLPCGGTVKTADDSNKSFFSRFIKFDAGINWRISLKEYFQNSNLSYDVVILTGGPFLHFSIIKLLRKKMGCKIVLDFRDPFANSPNMKMSIYKKWMKKWLEKKYINNADEVITVNSICVELLNKGKKTVHVIDNGYDDDILKKVTGSKVSDRKKTDLHKLVYPGKFYRGAPPDNFFSILTSLDIQGKFIFEYIGKDHHLVPESQNIKINKQMPYEKALERVLLADTGIIFTGGKPFESTTKVFDYIGLEKNILIITNGVVRTGVLNDITENYPNVFWTVNNRDMILETLLKIKETPALVRYVEKEKYSRREGLKKLIKLLKNL